MGPPYCVELECGCCCARPGFRTERGHSTIPASNRPLSTASLCHRQLNSWSQDAPAGFPGIFSENRATSRHHFSQSLSRSLLRSQTMIAQLHPLASKYIDVAPNGSVLQVPSLHHVAVGLSVAAKTCECIVSHRAPLAASPSPTTVRFRPPAHGALAKQALQCERSREIQHSC